MKVIRSHEETGPFILAAMFEPGNSGSAAFVRFNCPQPDIPNVS